VTGPTLRLHGPPAVQRPAGAVALSAREAALLAWLHHEGPTARAKLAGLLWPGGDEARARANLRQTLKRLKRDAGELLAEQGSVLSLAPGLAVAAGTGPGARLLGPIELDDAPELAEWLQARRDADARHRRRQLLAEGEAALAAGHSASALAAADAALADDATLEEAHRLRMRALLARGDRAAAIGAWDDCRNALRSAFGIAPSAQTNALGQSILAADAAPNTTAAAAPTLPAALRHPPLLVGRDAELAALNTALALGHTVLVSGGGGSGKSRLIHTALGQRVALRAGARPGDALQPGALAVRLLAQVLQGFAPPLPAAVREALQPWLPGAAAQPLRSGAEQQRMLQAWAGAVAAVTRGPAAALLVIDDLQWADSLSLQALAAWRGHDATAPLLLAARADEMDPDAQAWLQAEAGAGRLVRVPLAPLDEAGVMALLAALPAQALPAGAAADAAWAAQLHRRLGGQPGYVLESLKALWLAGPHERQGGPSPLPPVPPSLREAVQARLARLSPAALQLAQLASVAGTSFALPLAAAALNRAPLALAPLFAELEAAQVLHASGFEHDLVAEAVLASLPATLRPGLHGLVAEHLMHSGGPPGAIAVHLTAAGQRAAAALWQQRAGVHARDRWQLADAARCFEAALDQLDLTREREAALRAGSEAARCHLWRSDTPAADRVLQRVEPLARSAAERALLLTRRVILHVNQRQVQAAVAAAHQLADELRASAWQLASDDVNQALRALCVALPMANEDAQALALVDELSVHIDRSQPEQVLELQLARGGLLARAERSLQALPDLQAAFQAAQRLRRPGARVAAGGELLRALQALGRASEALAVGEATLATVHDGGFGAGFEYEMRAQVAMLLFALGRPAEAQRQTSAAEQCHARAERPAGDTLLRAVLRTMAGELDRAQALLAQAEPLPPPGITVIGQFHARAAARLAAARGGSAQAWLERATGWGASGLRHELALAAAGPPPAPAQAASWVASAQAAGWLPQLRLAQLQAARATLASGDRAGARAALAQALALAHAVDPWLEDTARQWVEAAALFDALGQPEAAAEQRRAGAAWVRRGAATLADGSAEQQAWLHGSTWHRALAQANPQAAPAPVKAARTTTRRRA
jgi:DNA-binding SARP family transcriptional activator